VPEFWIVNLRDACVEVFRAPDVGQRVYTERTVARRGDVLTVVDDQHGRPTSALDLAGALVAIVDRWHCGDDVGLGATYHLAGSGGASWFDLAAATMEECRRLGAPAAEVRPIGSSEWPTRASRPHNSILDCSRCERDFGFQLRPWREWLPAIVQRILRGV